jgi:hypothetical protein
MDVLERRCNVGGVQALPRKVVFGIFDKLVESINAFSTNSEDKVAGTFFWNTGTEHNTPLWKVYKQTVSCACFHFLTVVIGIDLTRQNHLRIAIVARFQSLQTETHCT